MKLTELSGSERVRQLLFVLAFLLCAYTMLHPMEAFAVTIYTNNFKKLFMVSSMHWKHPTTTTGCEISSGVSDTATGNTKSSMFLEKLLKSGVKTTGSIASFVLYGRWIYDSQSDKELGAGIVQTAAETDLLKEVKIPFACHLVHSRVVSDN
jgi:hypothetical protein